MNWVTDLAPPVLLHPYNPAQVQSEPDVEGTVWPNQAGAVKNGQTYHGRETPPVYHEM